MNERIRDFFLLVLVHGLILPVHWLIVRYIALHERVKEMYYRLFGIPYYKGYDKFHYTDYTVRRTDR
jgi:hypothetical protein